MHFLPSQFNNQVKMLIIRRLSCAFVIVGICRASVEPLVWRYLISPVEIFICLVLSSTTTQAREIFFFKFYFPNCQNKFSSDLGLFGFWAKNCSIEFASPNTLSSNHYLRLSVILILYLI